VKLFPALLFSLALAVCVFAAVRLTAQSAATLPGIGQKAPTFTLPSQDGSQISLNSFHGKWVVLYFYPKDMTSGCTIEAHNFQRDIKQFEAHHAVVLGVSVDSSSSHQQFCTKEGLTFRLLADQSHAVTKAYGSLSEHLGFAYAQRNTFLIDPQGNIAHVWTKVNPITASTDVLAALPAK
jgi:peroxiredoxin Q/BCP